MYQSIFQGLTGLTINEEILNQQNLCTILLTWLWRLRKFCFIFIVQRACESHALLKMPWTKKPSEFLWQNHLDVKHTINFST